MKKDKYIPNYLHQQILERLTIPRTQYWLAKVLKEPSESLRYHIRVLIKRKLIEKNNEGKVVLNDKNVVIKGDMTLVRINGSVIIYAKGGSSAAKLFM